VSCPFERQVSEYIDGDLELREMARLRNHMDACPGCARTEADLRRVVRGLRALPDLPAASDDVDDFAAIAARLAPTRRPRWQLGLVFAVAGMAAACVMLLHMRGAKAVTDAQVEERARVEYGVADAHWAETLAELRQIAEHDRPRWRPEVALRYDRRVRLLDEAVARTRAAAWHSDAGSDGMDLLFAAYRQEVDFFYEALGSASEGGQEVFAQ
jgi:hypothetical protein